MKSLAEYERENAEAVKRFNAGCRAKARAIVKAYLADVAAGSGPRDAENRRLVTAIERALRGES